MPTDDPDLLALIDTAREVRSDLSAAYDLLAYSGPDREARALRSIDRAQSLATTLVDGLEVLAERMPYLLSEEQVEDPHQWVLEPLLAVLRPRRAEFGSAVDRWAAGAFNAGELVDELRAQSRLEGEQRLIRIAEAVLTGDRSRATLDDLAGLSDLEAIFDTLRRARDRLGR